MPTRFPFRFVFSNGAQAVQFTDTIQAATTRAESLRAGYGAASVAVVLDAGFFPQPTGIPPFLHIKEIAVPAK